MRLIDADSIPWDVDGVGEIPVITKEEIGSMPTVDAVPVIRCKDCKYWNGSGKFCDYEMSGLENDFCSWAERKEE